MPNAAFPYALPWARINLRKFPHLYRHGKGEQGVLLCRPYKDELLPLWKFRTPAIAEESSCALEKKFDGYLAQDDFVGADLCQKFIMMGVTRARRYANHKGGKKYRVLEEDEEPPRGTKVKTTTNSKGKTVRKIELPRIEVESQDPEKAESARIFGVVLKRVQENPNYQRLLEKHKDDFNHIAVAKDVSEYLEADEDWFVKAEQDVEEDEPLFEADIAKTKQEDFSD